MRGPSSEDTCFEMVTVQKTVQPVHNGKLAPSSTCLDCLVCRHRDNISPVKSVFKTPRAGTLTWSCRTNKRKLLFFCVNFQLLLKYRPRHIWPFMGNLTTPIRLMTGRELKWITALFSPMKEVQKALFFPLPLLTLCTLSHDSCLI